MRTTFLLILSLLISTSFSQNTEVDIINKHFKLSCDCVSEVEYDLENSTTNYFIETNDGLGGYMITVKHVTMSKSAQSAFLKSIKNAGALDFEDIYFQNKEAIAADFISESLYLKQIGFFSQNDAYTIMVMATSDYRRELLFQNLNNTFKTY